MLEEYIHDLVFTARKMYLEKAANILRFESPNKVVDGHIPASLPIYGGNIIPNPSYGAADSGCP
jgi:hypothetical protein